MFVDKTRTYNTLKSEIIQFSESVRYLPLVEDESMVNTLAKQLVDSTRRVEYARRISLKGGSKEIANPSNTSFNPIKAAVYHRNNENLDEASWLVFLSTHFGYSPSSKWLLVSDIYGRLGESQLWSWDSVSKDIDGFTNWCKKNKEGIEALRLERKFGNHRKFESLKVDAKRSLSKVFASYVEMIGNSGLGAHKAFFSNALKFNDNSKYDTFDYLYRQTKNIFSFGRTGQFDYLTMLGKLDIVEIEPPKTYMSGATGPKAGARLLFGDKDMKVYELEKELFNLNSNLSINPFGMQVLEDALCNWQKSPKKYIHFRG
jgi:hypothetical protein